MYRFSLLVGFLLYVLCLSGQERQVNIPALSPFQKTEIKVGVVDVTVEYSRPSMRGRKIFGGLTPYGELWRTGANRNTKLTVSEPIIVGGAELPAGAYSIFTNPNRSSWEVLLYKELDEYGLPEEIDKRMIAAQFTVSVIPLGREIETLSLQFENITAKSTDLAISWEQTLVLIPIEIPTHQIISAKLSQETKTLIEDYRAAARIYFEVEQDYNRALSTINRSIALLEDGSSFEDYILMADTGDRHIPNKYLLKSEILAAQGEVEQAVKAAERSLRLAELVDDDYYRSRNLDNLLEWKN